MLPFRVSQFWIMLTALVLGTAPAMVWAGSQTKYPTSQSSSGWTNPDNVLLSDNTCARPPVPTNPPTTDTMTLVLPAFTIPAGAVLQGIQVGMEWSRSDAFTFQLGKDTGGGFVTAGNSKSSGSPQDNGNTCSQNTAIQYTPVATNDLWSSGLTAADLNNGYLRLRVTTPETGNQAWVDSINVVAYYSPVADIEVTSTESIDPVVAGSGASNLTYVVTVKNNGPDAATNVTVDADVDFPSGVSVVSVTPSVGTWAPPGAVPGTWTVGGLAVDATATLTIILTVGPGTAQGTDTIHLYACSDRTGAAEIDPDFDDNCPVGPDFNCPVDPTTNNCTEELTSVDRQFDLEITKTDSPDPVVVGNQLTYTIGVRNNGPSTAYDVEVIDTLPASYISYVSNTASGDCVNDSPSAGKITCSLGDMAPSLTFTYFDIVVAIDLATPHNTKLENSAEVISEENEEETNENDNTVGPVETTVYATIFTVTKNYSPAPVICEGQAEGAEAIAPIECLVPFPAVTINVTCQNGATATPMGDGTLEHGESQVWVIDNITTSTNCRARENPIPAGYTGSGNPQGSCVSGTMTEGTQASCTITNTLNTDTIRVYKEYTDGLTTPVDVTMNCTSGDVDDTGNTYNTKSVAGGSFVSFNVTGFNQATDASGEDTTCTITESNLPENYHQVSATGCSQTMRHQDNSVDCILTNAPDKAIFIIEKIWDQKGDTDALEVNAHLSCTGGTPTEQDVVFTATTDAVLFVYNIHDVPEGQQVDCTVTEDVPAGYSANYECNDDDCGDSDTKVQACFYSDVGFYGVYTCTITNRPLPAVLTVTKTWIIEGADQGFDGGFWLGANCDSRVDGPQDYEGCIGSPSNCGAQVREEEASSGSTDYEFTILKPNYPFTRCVIREDADDYVVESENGCGKRRLGPGDEDACEIVNTVFFEGIPTLNQYGMAILALLMLGVGLVGFRRFT